MGAGAILPDHLPASTFRNQLGSIGYTAAAAVKDLLVVVVEVVCVSFETVFCFLHRTHSTNTPKLNEASMLEGKRLQPQQQQHLYQCNQLLSISTHTPTTETSTIKLPGERAAAVVIISY